ncbi:ABC transporter permease subunit [Neisseria polysaccharea]|uniref:ABC transporter permease subunit n=1 Tax=Neisseria polysaccharea TaxID=489 RepID=UPI0027DECE3D|nr:ABC transporter permease subunit [Neisseria polysaccharea]
MADLTFQQAVSNIISMKGEIVRALGETFVMVGLSTTFAVIFGSTIGPVAASLVLSVSGLFYFARLVEQNLREVPKGVIEAAAAMGAPPLAIVRKVLLNEARAGMVSSITVLAIGLLSYSAAAGMIGGGGLGDLAIRYGYYRYQTEVIIFIVAILVLLVILIQSIGNALARKLDKR